MSLHHSAATLSISAADDSPIQQITPLLTENTHTHTLSPSFLLPRSLPSLPPLITDILISLDDKFLYFSNWLRGDVVQLDISDPAHPKLAGRAWLGGVARRGGAIKVVGGLPEDVGDELPEVPTLKGKTLQGGPQVSCTACCTACCGRGNLLTFQCVPCLVPWRPASIIAHPGDTPALSSKMHAAPLGSGPMAAAAAGW